MANIFKKISNSLFSNNPDYSVRGTDDSDGHMIQHVLSAIPKGCDVTLGYTGSDLTTVTYTRGFDTWTYTLTYDAGNLVGISCA